MSERKPSKSTIASRERLIQHLSAILFGDDYDESIDRAREMARDERLWGNAKARAEPRPTKTEGEG